jgi:hypothetical protein
MRTTTRTTLRTILRRTLAEDNTYKVLRITHEDHAINVRAAIT